MTDAPNGDSHGASGWSDGWHLGVAATAGIGLLLLGWALTVDFPKVTTGFFSDGATYYGLGHSLAEDFDFEYRREDLVRVWREFPSGPEGIFLKRGKDPDLELGGGFPWVHVVVHADADASRLYYAKSFIFPLFAAPFIVLFGTNGFLVLHAILMTAAFACAYAFLVARSRPAVALVFAGAYLFVSAAPVYMVWLTPDFFNAAMVTFGYFFWCYKEVAGVDPRRAGGLRERWLFGWRSDVMVAVFLGIATFSKPTHILLIFPVLAWFAWRRQWRQGFVTGLVFAGMVGGLFGANVAITGEWNYQGGDRRTFYSGMGGFPYQTEQNTFDAVGDDRSTNSVPVEVLATKDAVLQVFTRNLGYFFVGRHTGFAVYYFPGMLAILLFLFARGQRLRWQWLLLAGGLGSAVALILYMPYTYSGGGGPVGNRYFLGVYPVFLFALPPLASLTPGLVAIGVSSLFTAQLITNPFYVSFRPGEHTKRGLFRLLPVERSLVNDLPVNVSPSRSRQPLGGQPPVLAYFLDDNAYNREGDAFWVRGESRADVMLRAPAVAEAQPDGSQRFRSLTIPRLEVELETGAAATRVVIDTGAAHEVVEMPASQRKTVVVELQAGLPYRPYASNPTNYVYSLSIASSHGFIPLFETDSRDNRFLGVRVRLTPLYE
ncbi:MAG: hypothetical protein AB7O67_19155 [Vicinamibacterales bacterium]